MTESTLTTIAAWSYTLAAAAYFAFAIRMAVGWRRSVRATLLLAAVVATGLWAVAGVAVALVGGKSAQYASSATDLLRYAAWFAFLASLLAAARSADGSRISGPIPRWLWVVAAAALAASVAISMGPVAEALGLEGPRAEFGIRVGLAVFGLVLVEQLIRRVGPDARWAIKPLCAALAGVFGFDLFLFADAMLFGRIDVAIWVARSVANLIVIPFVAIATARNTGWTVEMHLSRKPPPAICCVISEAIGAARCRSSSFSPPCSRWFWWLLRAASAPSSRSSSASTSFLIAMTIARNGCASRARCLAKAACKLFKSVR